MEFLLALQFLTRIPVNIQGDVTEKNLARSMAFYPLVGLIIGLITAALYNLLSFVFPDPACDLFAIAFLVFITGNMHGDALMDTADGLFSGKPKEKILEIMKDSRVGSHGVMAGVLDLLGKYVLFSLVPQAYEMPALILIPTLGRWALVFGSARYPYARVGQGTGLFTDHVGNRELAWASLTVLAASGVLIGVPGIILFGLTTIGTLALNKFITSKLGGVTGDTLGATNEGIELLALLMLPVVIKTSGKFLF